QASVAPCLLISGFGFLLLTMTNRLGRASDRVRLLLDHLDAAKDKRRHLIRKEIKIFYNRCQYLRTAIALLVTSISFVAMNVLLLFLSIIFEMNLKLIIEAFFAASLGCLIISLLVFMMDISLTLKTLKLEIDDRLGNER
ncbi:MAG: DUF2721 domain-containing protein, partial [Candidatus Omnitrophica bacterium]|nr:DUF2721 domain-containing protein [Candidatus Omnitrophota bacterium]